MHGLAGNRFLMPSRLGFALSQQWSRRVELLKTATVGACGKTTKATQQRRGNGHSVSMVVATAATQRLTTGQAAVSSSNRTHNTMRHRHIEMNDVISAWHVVAMS